MPHKKIFIILGILWVLILGGFIAYKEYILRSGTEVVLRTIPVDPKDLFRGDYVTLRYDISSIDTSLYGNSASFADKPFIYVSLVKDEHGYGKIANIYDHLPQEGLFLKGKIESIRENIIVVTYGIESYFVPSGKGKIIEERRGEGVDAKIAVDKSGNAVIKKVLLDGKELSL